MMKRNLRNTACVLLMGLCAVACSDNEKDKNIDTQANVKKVTNLNASAYDQWTYINLETGATETHPDASEWIYTDGTTRPAESPEAVGIDWHIAVHRYEIKTNGGEALETDLTNLAAVTELPKGNYTADKNFAYNKNNLYEVITDRSKMAQRNIGYSNDFTLNPVLCGWVDIEVTGGMPPKLYTPTQKVLILKCKDGGWAKLQFTTAGNSENGKSGFISFNYVYTPAAR